MIKLGREKTKQIIEPFPDRWLNQTRKQLSNLGLESCGHDALDRAMRFPKAPLESRPVANQLAPEEAPQSCQYCGIEICCEGKHEPFVDGAIKGSGWAYLCISCHRDHGRGMGIGRGTLYCWDAEKQLYCKVENR